ncbi:PadR family transcriptional regulator [Anaerorhabdus sp.]|uniref:PadR family transcriptional regulator n=1 Tax=Anaerorhabdus sp. TaxID=1872524 RepID=UPI002FCB760C
MDIQLKKGFLEYCVLAALKKKDSYGYQVVKDVSNCIDISESTLYPILKRLETDKQVSTYSVEHNGRLRKYYHIETKGIDQIKKFLEDWEQIQKIYQYIEEEMKDDKE